MLNKYLAANGNEDDATQQLGMQPSGYATAGDDAKRGTAEGKHERHQADGEQGKGDVAQGAEAGAGKGDAYCQRVDAGGYGHGENDCQLAGIEQMLFFFVAETLAYHVDSQETQQREGNPVVHLLNQAADVDEERPADERHEGLEETEEEGHQQDGAPLKATQDDAAGNRHGETVHGKPEGK